VTSYHLLRLALLFLMFSLGLAQAEPTELEIRLVEQIDANNANATKLLEQLVNINSGTMNLAGVKAVGDTLAAEFKQLGFSTRWEDGKSFARAGHLIAEHHGTPSDNGGDNGSNTNSAPRLLLIGHLDTVFEPSSPFQRYELLPNNQAKGPGIIDMKGGNVIILEALRALKAVGELDRMDITVVMTGDEELSGRPLTRSKKALIDAAEYADIALGFENGDGKPTTANVSRRGSIGWTLSIKGKPAHSSQVFREDIGPGAIYEAARILNRFYTDLRNEDLLTFNPGKILGGTTVTHDKQTSSGTVYGKNNVVAESALVTGDIRAISEEQLARVKAKMTDIVAQSYPHTQATITFSDGYPAMAPTAGNQRLLGIYSQISEDLGYGKVVAVNPLRAGAADVSFTADQVDMAIDGLGMGGTGAHTVKEIGDMNTLAQQAKRAAVLMLRLQTSR
jgi:glutamate carboxypeptidase